MINAEPTAEAKNADDLARAVASVWILESDIELAEKYARDHIQEFGWEPLETTSRHQPSRAQIARLDEHEVLKSIEACTQGFALTVIAARKNQAVSPAEPKGRLEARDLELKRGSRSEKDFWRDEREHQKLRMVRRCLHPMASSDVCDRVVRAHSIQRAGGLARIGREGHVYRIDGESATLLREGRMRAKLVGIGQASTFSGLCGHHDNLAFQALEKRPFDGDYEQCFLLAYRAVLREAYIKEAAAKAGGRLLEILRGQPAPRQTALRPTISAFVRGTRSGLQMIANHKRLYDEMLLHEQWAALRSILIRFARVPDTLMAAAWAPIVDFDGNILENAARLESLTGVPDIVAVSTFPWDDGGGCLFAWHPSSDRACVQLAASLTSISEGRLSDALVRWAFEVSENIYLRPDWWEGLGEPEREALLDRMADSANPTAPLRADALCDDGLSLANWEPVSIRLRVPHDGKLVEVVSDAPWAKPKAGPK